MAALQTLHQLLEHDAATQSVATFVYDSTPSAPFGANLESLNSSGKVYNMQVRAGAGSSLVGYVESAAFTSAGAEAAEKPVAVLGSTAAFLALVPSLLSLPEPTKRPTLTIHVSAQSSSLATDEESEPTLTQVPELGSVFEGVKRLQEGGWNGVVVLSETAEEAAAVGTGLAKGVAAAGADLVNVFDGLTAGRQLATLPATAAVAPAGSVEATVESAVPFFTYSGSKEATKVLVLPASAYSAAAKAAIAAARITDVGVLSVRLLKPWNAEALLKAVPSSAKSLHVFNEGEAAGPLFEEVRHLLPTA